MGLSLEVSASSISSSRRFEFPKRSQPFIGMHNETLTLAMRVDDEDCSTARIQR